MLNLVYGGSASGKSSYAERQAVALAGSGRLIYLATMYPYKWDTRETDPEIEQRIRRHREMRAGKGFETVESYRDVDTIAAGADDVVLLECMSNLLANEMYLPAVPNDAAAALRIPEVSGKIIREILNLTARVRAVVVVTNDIFSDGGNAIYDESTREYIRNLAVINRELAEHAAVVTELVCGIPVISKEYIGIRTAKREVRSSCSRLS